MLQDCNTYTQMCIRVLCAAVSAQVWLGLAAEAGATEAETAPMRAMVQVAQMAARQGSGAATAQSATSSGAGTSAATAATIPIKVLPLQQHVVAGSIPSSGSPPLQKDPFPGQGWGVGPAAGVARVSGGGAHMGMRGLDREGAGEEGQSLLGGPL